MKGLPPALLGFALGLVPYWVWGETVHVEVKPLGNNASAIFLRTDVGAPQASLWKWLTDYDHQAGYMPYMTKSKVVGKEGQDLLVDQAGTIRILFWSFTMRMKQRVSEEALRHMHFKAVDGDFSSLEGDFHLKAASGSTDHTQLECEFTVQPKRRVPNWAVRMAAKRYLRKMVNVLAQKAEQGGK
jgi:ribosome-associated toxin RatA of RatAB toxin-antitoxin module